MSDRIPIHSPVHNPETRVRGRPHPTRPQGFQQSRRSAEEKTLRILLYPLFRKLVGI
jgi:hypothetical protein